jgi:hypothetical protein
MIMCITVIFINIEINIIYRVNVKKSILFYLIILLKLSAMGARLRSTRYRVQYRFLFGHITKTTVNM